MSSEAVNSYRALALQLRCDAVSKASTSQEARTFIKNNITRLKKNLEATLQLKIMIGDCKLIVLPEYLLTGFPSHESPREWIEKACFLPNGPEIEELAFLAQHTGIFLAGNVYEVDPHFSNLFFQTCIIFNPLGAICLRYRRLNSMFTPSPHDVWNDYLDRYGLEGIFPVADTEIGRLGAIASEEILFPEVARCLAMQGAEVLVHPTSESFSPELTPKEICRRARAIENLAYVVSANTAGVYNTDLPAASADGGSCIIDYKGTVLSRADVGESMSTYAEIDLAALRRARRQIGMGNLLSRLRCEPYASFYQHADVYPPNTFSKEPIQRGKSVEIQKRIIENLILANKL